LTFGEPDSGGVPASIAQHTLTLEYNNAQQLHDVFKEMGDQIACVIIEPVAGNMNLIVPHMAFLKTLRELCTKHGTVLIFDEVMTGFRVALGGAQALYNIQPDMTTLGKVIGGGMPMAAFGGRKDIMQCLAPLGKVYQAGTLSGNPVAVSAGLATLKLIQAPEFYEKLSAQTKKFVDGLMSAAKTAGIPFSAQSVGGMFGLYFSEACPNSFAEIMQNNDKNRFNQFFHHMLDLGIYLAPSAFEAGFVSAAHSDEDLQKTIQAASEAFTALKSA
jgi:glutamate-1-semialdehyde 2,1-aminomutase